MSQYIDAVERQEIIERWMPYGAGGVCMWCGSPEGQRHETACRWLRVRRENKLKVAA